MNKFEQLIEYVINENDAKAEELFHDIVVAKSRDIYESLMDMDNEMGGDQADELINDISADETGMRESDEDEEMGAEEFGGEEDMGMEPEMDADGDFDGSEEGEADLEDRVVDLEDQLDALMAEFDSAIGGDDMEPEMGDDMEPEMGDEFGAEEEMEGRFNEALSLTKVTKGISTSTEAEGTNKKSINADNSGNKGALAKPHPVTGTEAKGDANPAVKAGNSTTKPAQKKVTEPKKKGEDAATNKKSISGS